MRKIKILIFTTCLMASVSSFAQKVKLTVQFSAAKDSIVHLVNSQREINMSLKAEANHLFKLTIKDLNSGFYNLTGVGRVYLKPGFDLKINKGADSSLVFTGEGSLENNILLKIKQQDSKILPSNPLTGGTSFSLSKWPLDKNLFPAIEAYKAAVAQSVASSQDTLFKKLVLGDADSYVRNQMALIKITFNGDSARYVYANQLQNTPDPKDPFHTQKVQQAIYKLMNHMMNSRDKNRIDSLFFANLDWNNEALFYNSEQYATILVTGMKMLQDKQPAQDRDFSALTLTDEKITNPVIKAHLKTGFAITYLKKEKDKDRAEAVYKDLLALPLSDTDKEKLSGLMASINMVKDPSTLDFTYPDVNGKMISLKDLRGKYIYIDVWATWCIPCLEEVPALKKIEDLYKGKNIQFVSLSVDVQTKKELWQKMAKTNGLSGLQVMADKAFGSAFIQGFGISSIPRFILIDPKGAVVAADAFRPSNPKLKEQLDKLL